MKISVRYFTRGGNTKKLADAIGNAVGVQAETVDINLDEKVDILFLGCSYYAFDMDAKVKKFITANKDKIGKLVMFGSSAMMKSMKKPMLKVLDGTGVELCDDEFHCRGEFGPANKGKPDDTDLAAAAEFAKKIANC